MSHRISQKDPFVSTASTQVSSKRNQLYKEVPYSRFFQTLSGSLASTWPARWQGWQCSCRGFQGCVLWNQNRQCPHYHQYQHACFIYRASSPSAVLQSHYVGLKGQAVAETPAGVARALLYVHVHSKDLTTPSRLY